MRRGAWAVGALLLAGSARAQDRPTEDEMFGGSSQVAPATPPAAAPAEARPGGETGSGTTTGTGTATSTGTGTTSDARDMLNLGNPDAGTRFSSSLAPEDPLKMGGQFYWRAASYGGQGQNPEDWRLSAPGLLDVYMDARPNDRVRAFILGRMLYDPTLPVDGTTSSSTTSLSSNSVQGSDSTSSSLFGQQPTRGPSAVLDQMWLSFDILHTVFVTAGKQHVRWGTARFWAPTDYLHAQARNPLLPFDARTGTTMLKLEVPWEEHGWNFYAYALPENVDATRTTGSVAGAARAEIVLGTLEAGAGVFGRKNSKAKFAGDVSFGVWDLDFYGEAALRDAGDIDFVHYDGGSSVDCTQVAASGGSFGSYYTVARGSGWKPQVTGGVSYTHLYADKDTFTIGGEYFYNGLGYSNVKDYLGLFALSQSLKNPAPFFYLGRQYVALFATAPAPYSWDNTTFTLSTLANLSDQSGITRFDYALTVLTHVRFEAYAAVHWGQQHGEFRLGFNTDELPCPPPTPLVQKPALFDLGVGLRVGI
jgi:hypothetical protein